MSSFGRTRPAKNPLPLHERALGLLAVRARGRRELEVRLLQAGFEPGEVEAELERLEAVGLLDDERFAQDFTEHAAVSRKQGRRAIAGALAAKGLSPATISRSMEHLEETEESRARALAEDRARRLGGLPPEKAFRRLFALLVRKGYDHSLARKAATDALARDPGEEWSG